jgi:CRP/FNR family transcriptional regulator, cyclic AMP receptor protein
LSLAARNAHRHDAGCLTSLAWRFALVGALARRRRKNAAGGIMGNGERDMSLIPDKTTFQNSIATLPLKTYQAGEIVIADGSRSGRLLILKKGKVAIVKKGHEIAEVVEPGAVFGEISALLDQPHAADVRTLETSQFHVADATTLLTQNPIAVLYVATMLAHRLNGANHALIELKHQLSTGQPQSVVAQTVSKMEGLLIASSTLVYSGYPNDPYA